MNQFIDLIGHKTFFLDSRRIRLLTGYLRMLFTRSVGRKAASAIHAKAKMEALRSLLKDDKKLSAVTAKYTADAMRLGLLATEAFMKETIIAVTEKKIAEHSSPDEAQRDYINAVETMMAFPDEGMLNGQWGIMTTDPAQPFVIGDAPVVTMERTEDNRLYFGLGFARPNVEVFLPVSPAACIHVLPLVARTRQVQPPSVTEVNMAQAAFATQHCFGSMWGFRRRRTLIPGGTRTAFRAEGEQISERSDAGTSIVQEVFAFVKENHPERSGGSAPLAEKGVRGKGRQPLSPLSAPEVGER